MGEIFKEPLWSEEREQKSLLRFLAIVASVLFIFLCARFALETRYVRVQVSGTSMLQTLSDGDILRADRKAEIKHGDVVVIDVRGKIGFDDECEYIIKRVIALEGDKLYGTYDHKTYILYAGESNFTELSEPYAYVSRKNESGTFHQVAVGTGEIFVMGDNRVDSYDSRMAGTFKTCDVVGVVTEFSMNAKGFSTFLYKAFGI